MVQMVKCLGSKHDDLSSISSTHTAARYIIEACNPSTGEAEARVSLGQVLLSSQSS